MGHYPCSMDIQKVPTLWLYFSFFEGGTWGGRGVTSRFAEIFQLQDWLVHDFYARISRNGFTIWDAFFLLRVFQLHCHVSSTATCCCLGKWDGCVKPSCHCTSVDGPGMTVAFVFFEGGASHKSTAFSLISGPQGLASRKARIAIKAWSVFDS